MDTSTRARAKISAATMLGVASALFVTSAAVGVTEGPAGPVYSNSAVLLGIQQVTANIPPSISKAHLIHLKPESGSSSDILTYCIEPFVPLGESGYIPVAGEHVLYGDYWPEMWSDRRSRKWSELQGRVNWILANSVPALPVGTLIDRLNAAAAAAGWSGPTWQASSVSTADIEAATQAAIWAVTADSTLVMTQIKTVPPPTPFVEALYTYLVDGSSTVNSASPSSVTWGPDPSGSSGGLVGPVTLQATPEATVSVDLPAGFELFSDAHKTKKVHPNDRLSDGSTLYLSVPANAAPGTLQIKASTVAGRIWTVPDSRPTGDPTEWAPPQAVVEPRTISTLATFSWAQSPVPSLSPIPNPPPGTDSPSPPALPTPTSSPRDPKSTQAPDPKPVKPREPVPPTNSAATQGTVRRTFQVDSYLPRTAAQARAVAGLDDDGVLRYREDRSLWRSSRWQFVTVRLPAKATTAQVMKAVNAATSPRIGDVRTTNRLTSARVGAPVTIVWELGRGATQASAWGPKNRTSQTFLART